MKYAEALKAIEGLSHPTKMPWWAWSISAENCITGSKLAAQEGTVCSGCYALKGNYRFPNVKDAQTRRQAAAERPEFVEAFVIVLTNLYNKTRKRRANGGTENRFRWFDSGDLQSVEMLEKINEIAKATPFIDHWLPTRENAIVDQFLQKHGDFADNLTVRISVPLVGRRPTSRPLGLPMATVGCDDDRQIHHCPAMASQGNRCLDCSMCWDRRVDVNYQLH